MTQANIFHIDYSEIQGNVIRGYGAHAAKYIFYQMGQPEKGREWLKRILEEHNVTTSEFWSKDVGQTEEIRTTLNVAVTYSGLKVLGVSESSLWKFPPEFIDGMSKRAVEILGDEPQTYKDKSGKRVKTDPVVPKWGTKWCNPPENVHALLIITTKVVKKEEKKKKDTEKDPSRPCQKSKSKTRGALSTDSNFS